MAIIEPQEKCTMLHVQNVERRPRSPSNLMDHDRYTAKNAIKNIGLPDSQGGTETIR